MLLSYSTINEAHASFFGMKKSDLEYKDLYDIFDINTANKLSEINWNLFKKATTQKWKLNLKIGKTKID